MSCSSPSSSVGRECFLRGRDLNDEEEESEERSSEEAREDPAACEGAWLLKEEWRHVFCVVGSVVNPVPMLACTRRHVLHGMRV